MPPSSQRSIQHSIQRHVPQHFIGDYYSHRRIRKPFASQWLLNFFYTGTKCSPAVGYPLGTKSAVKVTLPILLSQCINECTLLSFKQKK